MITPTWKDYRSTVTVNGWLGLGIIAAFVIATILFIYYCV